MHSIYIAVAGFESRCHPYSHWWWCRKRRMVQVASMPTKCQESCWCCVDVSFQQSP